MRDLKINEKLLKIKVFKLDFAKNTPFTAYTLIIYIFYCVIEKKIMGKILKKVPL